MKELGIILCVIAAVIIPNSASAETKEKSKWHDTISIEGMIDARVVYKAFDVNAKDVDALRTSDIQVRYAGLGAVIEPTDFIEAYMLFLFEEFYGGREDAPFAYFGDGSENFDMDEGWVKLHNNGAFFRIGKGYLPFTHETTFAVKDPLTWYYGDCRHTLAEIGYEHDIITLSVGAFNGNSDNADSHGEPGDDMIDGFVIHAHVNPLTRISGYSLEIGGGFINDLTEAAIGSDFLDPNGNYENNVFGYSGYLHFEAEFTQNIGLGVEFEYASSGEFDRDNYVNAADEQTAIDAINAEVQAPFLKHYWIGGKYESIGGLDWMETAQYNSDFEPTAFHGYGGFAGTNVLKPVTLAFQFIRGVDNESNAMTELIFQTLLEF